MADHSRLGRGLAALMGDVGEETPAADSGAQAAQRADRKSHRQSAQPAPQFHRSRTQRAGRLDQGARHHPADRGAPGARQGRALRDHRRRAALARGAARRPARGADRHRRGDRRAGARIRHHRERAARRFESDRGGGRLSGADGRIQSQPGRGGADRRQEPLACRQHGAAVEAVGAGAGAGAHPASSRPATRANWSASPTRSRSRRTSSSAASTCGRSRLDMRKDGARQARERRSEPGTLARQGRRHQARWSGGCPTRSGLR